MASFRSDLILCPATSVPAFSISLFLYHAHHLCGVRGPALALCSGLNALQSNRARARLCIEAVREREEATLHYASSSSQPPYVGISPSIAPFRVLLYKLYNLDALLMSACGSMKKKGLQAHMSDPLQATAAQLEPKFVHTLEQNIAGRHGEMRGRQCDKYGQDMTEFSWTTHATQCCPDEKDL